MYPHPIETTVTGEESRMKAITTLIKILRMSKKIGTGPALSKP
jgi:hypothetical protein